MLAEPGKVIGWIAAAAQYGDSGWELHPLIVHPAYQDQGIGRALVNDLEHEIRKRGGITLFVCTDDEDNSTSLGGRDLYPDVLAHTANINNLNRHPFEFYLKLGFFITSVIPNANGYGRPDIILARRL
jgi:aminoglycoside 6'-N-acetyltransferase I